MIKAMKKRISNNKGLTLIELIIVIAIIGILAVIGVTQFGGMSNSARISADIASAAEIASAAKMYEAENGKAATAISELTPYLDKTDIVSQYATAKGDSEVKFELAPASSGSAAEGTEGAEGYKPAVPASDFQVKAGTYTFYPSEAAPVE